MTAAEMLAGVAGDLHREGVALVLAGDVGRVRDVLRRTDRDGSTPLQRYPTVAAAVDELSRARWE